MEQLDILKHSVDSLERIRVPYMIVGSYACFAYGESRFTQDIDIVIEMFPGQVKAFCEAFPAPDFFVSEDAVKDAVKNRFQFNVLHPSSGNKIDFIFSRNDDWATSRMQRRQSARIHPERDVMLASPEDIIIGKLWFYSEGKSDKHLRDIAGILKVSGDSLDRNYLAKWVRKLGYTSIWDQCLQQVENTNL